LPAWLSNRQAIQGQIRDRVANNLAELDQQVASQDTISRLAFEGGWYAVLRIAALGPDEATARALLDRGVWVHPGYFFGMPESGWLVVSLLAPEREFSVGVTHMLDGLREHQVSNSWEGSN